jgi:hypothetical protein
MKIGLNRFRIGLSGGYFELDNESHYSIDYGTYFGHLNDYQLLKSTTSVGLVLLHAFL